ncbi:6262_t:CDS:1, partial [Scutellospora calospora]
MSNKKEILNIFNNLSDCVVQNFKTCSTNTSQSPQLYSSNNNTSQDFMNEIIEKLCNLCIEEEKKGNLATSILNSIENYLLNERLEPNYIIKL